MAPWQFYRCRTRFQTIFLHVLVYESVLGDQGWENRSLCSWKFIGCTLGDVYAFVFLFESWVHGIMSGWFGIPPFRKLPDDILSIYGFRDDLTLPSRWLDVSTEVFSWSSVEVIQVRRMRAAEKCPKSMRKENNRTDHCKWVIFQQTKFDIQGVIKWGHLNY